MLFSVVLVADDEPMLRNYLSSILHSKGFQVIEAAGGREGLELVERTDGRLDAIVSDVQMPDGDGITFVGAVRERYPRIPCILISGVVRLDSTVDARFLQKPFSPAQLLEELQCAMDEGPRALEVCE